MSRAEQRYSFVQRAILVLVFLASFSSHALIRYVFDFDGTLVQDQGPSAAWRTAWKLVRSDERHTSLQVNPAEPVELTIPSGEAKGKKILVQHPDILNVSYGEYKKLRRFLAGEDGGFGTIDPNNPAHLPPALLDAHRPEWIIPGFYRVSLDVTYDRFQTIGRKFEVPPLEEDYQLAKQRTQLTIATERPLQWQGPAYPMLKNLLANKENKNRFSIVTARGETISGFDQLFALMYADGFIPNQPKDLGYTLLSLRDPKNLHLVGKGPLEQRKQAATRLEATQLLMRPKAQMHFELSSDPRRAEAGELEKRHTLIFPEDDPINAQKIGELMASLSMHPHFKFDAKFVLFQTGELEDLNPRWPYEFVVFHDGRGRPATKKEIFIWENALEPQSPCEYDLL